MMDKKFYAIIAPFGIGSLLTMIYVNANYIILGVLLSLILLLFYGGKKKEKNE